MDRRFSPRYAPSKPHEVPTGLSGMVGPGLSEFDLADRQMKQTAACQRRPECHLCTISQRRCTYTSERSPHNASRLGSSNHDHDHGTPCNQKEQIAVSSNIAEPIDSDFPFDPMKYLKGSDNSSAPKIEAVNFDHMELIVHLISDKSINCLATTVGDYSTRISFALRTGLSNPYLLHQLLAFSARHLAYLRPAQSSTYLNRAVELQTQAISLFTSAWTGPVNPANCAAVLLFSSMLGHHSLADTLSKRPPNGLEGFLPHYLQCLELHKGISAIAKTAWPMLMDSELAPILANSTQFTSQKPVLGNFCLSLAELVDRMIDEDEKEACREAIRFIQIGLDAMCPKNSQDVEVEDGTRNYEMAALWSMLVSPKFTTLLAAKRPEALVIQAHYALLLHYAKHMWQVGDAGTYMLSIIADHLGDSWNHWLQGPLEVVHRDRM